MSFSADLKTELCGLVPKAKDKLKSLCRGMLLYARALDSEAVALVTESAAVASLYSKLLMTVYETRTETASRERTDGSTLYSVTVPEAGERQKLMDALGAGFCRDTDATEEKNLPEYLRGVYLVCGTLTDPNKSYHLELTAPGKSLSERLAVQMGEVLASPKVVSRRGAAVLYYKESEHIEDFLTFIGASHRALEIMEIKVMKDVRNKVNRRTNCETANIDRVVAASARQVEDIKLILEKKGEMYLPENLRELALLRLEGPELSLSELGEQLSTPLTRSGVNHRLEKISAIAEKLRQ